MKKKTISIGGLIKSMLICSLALVIAVLLFVSLYVNQALQQQASRVYQTTMDLYREQLDSNMEDINNYLYYYSTGNQDIRMLTDDHSPKEQYQIKKRISDSLGEALSLHDLVDGVFVVSGAEYLGNSSGITDFKEDVFIQDALLDMVETASVETASWFCRDIQGINYLFRIISVGSVYCGVWITQDTLQYSMDRINFGEGAVSLFCTADGNVLNPKKEIPDFLSVQSHNNYQTMKMGEDQYVLVQSPVSFGKFQLASLIPVEYLTRDLSPLKNTLFILAIVLLLLIPASWVLSERMIYYPFKTLVGAMVKVKDGDLDTQATDGQHLKEFELANRIFNDMVANIKTLKIDSYEKTINEQRIRRQFLKSQIKSHFFLNCLNLIYSYAQLNDYQIIQDLALCLVKYFRYISENADDLVPLQAELEHMENFLHIQSIRFPDWFEYRLDLDPEVDKLRIPPLTLQTFVENSIKHAENEGVKIRIIVTIHKIGDVVEIQIRDNGPGYPPTILAGLNREDPLKLSGIQGIGINNVKNRIQMFYQGKAGLVFSNAHGAVVQITIPYEEGDDEYSAG